MVVSGLRECSAALAAIGPGLRMRAVGVAAITLDASGLPDRTAAGRRSDRGRPGFLRGEHAAVAPTGSAFPHTAIAPGRVNLIGEHIDYNGLPVLPMAIDRAVRIEFRPVRDPAVRLDNASERFAPFEFRLDRPIVALARGHWSNYVRAAARGLLAHGIELRRGMEGRVAGDVPIAAGLSSSSALVVAAALALLRANGVEVTGRAGGQAGGRDAVPGHRQGTFVSARRAESCRKRSGMPDGAEAAAPGTGRGAVAHGQHDGFMVREDHEGKGIARLELAALMARAERFVGLEGGGMDQAACLFGVAGHALRIEFDPLCVTPVAVPEGWRWVVASSLSRAEKSAGARGAFNERARQCREALGRLERGVAGSALAYRDLVRVDDVEGVLRYARQTLDPLLFRRFRHVVTEGRRVALAEAAMRGGDLRRFGALMVQSHESLRDDYEVSTPELDALVEMALEAGAAGARLTGAGFGGCAVALCDEAAVGAVMEALATGFYEPRLGRPPTAEEVFGVGGEHRVT